MPNRDKQSIVEVWYRRKTTFRSDPDLSALRLHETHVHVHNVVVDMRLRNTLDALEYTYRQMQGENWSPQGQARSLLRRRAVFHTSMSIGDVVVLPDDSAWECKENGWRNIGQLVVWPTTAAIYENLPSKQGQG